MMQFLQSQATAARRRVPLHLVDATDGITPETGEAAGQPQISKNGAAFSNTTATLTAIANGAYYVELTAAELDTAGFAIVRYKSANTAEAQVAFAVVPQLAEQAMLSYTQPTGFLAATFPGGTVASTTNITAGTITTATNLTDLPAIPANWLTAAGIAAAALNGKGDWNIGKTGYALSAAGVQAIWDAATSALTVAGTIGKRLADFVTGDAFVRLGAPAGASVSADIAGVNTDTDALLVRLPATFPELSQAAPAATPTLAEAIMLPYMAMRNALTIDATNKKISNDAGTVIVKKVLSDDGTTYTEAEMAAGP